MKPWTWLKEHAGLYEGGGAVTPVVRASMHAETIRFGETAIKEEVKGTLMSLVARASSAAPGEE